MAWLGGALRWVSARGYPVLAVLLAGLGATQVLTEPDNHLAVVLPGVLVAALGVSLLRAAALPAVGLILAAVVVIQIVAGTPPFATFVATMSAVYALARHGSRRTVLTGYAMVLATFGILAASQLHAGTDGAFGIVIVLVYWAVVAGAGWATRQRAAYTRAVSERAAALEREREHLAQLAAAAERARLARELHDVIAHGVSLMVLQAEAAGEVLASRPEQAACTIEAIGDAGRRAVADLGNLLGLLRGPAAAACPEADLHALLAPVRLAGLDVRLTGEESVPEALRATVYRVVQEALTNVVKHSGARSVTVAVRRTGAELTVEVSDDGAGRAGAGTGTGRGLAGMAERVAALGGSLAAAAVVPQGFRLFVRLPAGAAATDDSTRGAWAPAAGGAGVGGAPGPAGVVAGWPASGARAASGTAG